MTVGENETGTAEIVDNDFYNKGKVSIKTDTPKMVDNDLDDTDESLNETDTLEMVDNGVYNEEEVGMNSMNKLVHWGWLIMVCKTK